MRNLRHLSVISVRKNLVSKRTLLSHKQIVHCNVNCDVCGKVIYNSFEKSTPFECDQCTRKFGLKHTLLSQTNQCYHCGQIIQLLDKVNKVQIF